jgi:hypothetical protein
MVSFPGQEQIQREAAADMGTRTAEVGEQIRIRAAGFFQGVSQYPKAGVVQGAGWQRPLLVN